MLRLHCSDVPSMMVRQIRPWNEMDGMEVEENTWNYHRASIQIAELEYVDGKIVCDRDRYFMKVPSPIERKK